MKRLFTLFAIIIIFLLFPKSVCAYTESQTEYIADTAGTEAIESDYLTEEERNGEKSINIFEKAIAIIIDYLSGSGRGLIRSFGVILAFVLLACLMHLLELSDSDKLSPICRYISLLSLSGVTYSLLYSLFIYVIASMESLNLAVSSLMPIMASLHAMGGTAGAGAASGAGLTLFLTVLSSICTKVLLPLLQVSFAICFVGAVPQGVNLSSVASLVRGTVTTVMACIFSLLGFSLYMQTSVAAAGDSYITRSIKFATGAIVPVIGGMLGEASRTVIASVAVVKGTVGAAGVVIVLSLTLPPIIAVAMHRLMLSLCASCAKALGCEREGGFLQDLSGITAILLALVAGAAAVAIIALAVFIKTGVTV